MPEAPWPAVKVRPLRRGCFKLLLLKLLEGREATGYELIKELRAITHGLYAPSPGLVYPALKALEREGLVESSASVGGRVYKLTERGAKLLEERREEAERLLDFLRKATSDERLAVHLALKKLAKLLFVHSDELVGEKALVVARIIEEARERVARALEEGGERSWRTP